MATKGKKSKRAIDKAAFDQYPFWAKQAFAYRLLYTLAEPVLSKNLNKMFRHAQLHPEANFPKDLDIPPGIIIMPDQEFPDGWQAGDPLPPGGMPAPPQIITEATQSSIPPTFVGTFTPGAPNPAGGNTPVEPIWREFTTDSFWEETLYHFFWTGASWEKTAGLGGADIKVKVGTTWAEGLNPIAIRITYTGAASNWTLTDSNGGWVLGPGLAIASGEIVYFTLNPDYDIKYLGIEAAATVKNVTKIEFLA